MPAFKPFEPHTTLPPSMQRLIPWLVAVAFFMESLDTTILNTAVPTIAEALGVPPLSMKSVLACYTLSLAVFIPMSGWMADRFGTRAVFSSAIGVFTLGSLLCGLSTNIHLLVFCRILQGIGGAMMVPIGRLTLIRTFPKSELMRAMTFVAIPSLVGPLLGPLIGGIIVRYTHWRMIFFVNIPVGILGLFLIHRFLPDYRATKNEKLDVIGFILFGAGVALLSYVLEVFGEHTLTDFEMLGLFAISVLLLFGYARHALTTKYPLLRLSLFRTRSFRVSIAGNFGTRLGIGGMPFLLPMLYQVGLGYSPVESGLLVLPQSLAAMSLKMVVVQFLNRFGYRRILVANTVGLGLLIMLFATIDLGTPAWLITIQSFCFGFLSSLQYSSMNTLVYADVSENQSSMASTIASTIQQLSLSFGVAAASLATAVFIPNRFNSTPGELITGIHSAFLVLGILTIGSSFVFRELSDNDGQSISRHKAPLSIE